MEEKRGYIENLSTNDCAVDKNKQLWDLYETWFKHLNNNSVKINGFNAPQLLTCSDHYCKDNVKVMMIGKESNSDDLSLCNALEIGLSGVSYLGNCYYKYDEKVVAHKARSTHYLKTRLLLCGKDYNKETKLSLSDVNKVLLNNLNKSSYGGKYTPRCKEHKNLYDEFEFNGISHNIFIHELNILRPTHIVLACGYGYDDHIKNSLGKDVYETVEGHRIVSSSDSISRYNENLKLNLSKINLTAKIIHVPHPTSRMRGDTRSAYNELLNSFISR